MAIIGVDLLPGSSCGINERFQRTYVRRYQIISDDLADDEYYIRTHCGFSLFSGHPDDAGARLKEIQVDHKQRLADPRGDGSDVQGSQWHVLLTYGYIDPLNVSTSGSPEAQPLEVRIDGEIYVKTVDKDTSGNPVVNAAGDKFDPGVEADQTRCTISVAQNFASLVSSGANPIATLLGYANKINSDTWFGFAPHTVKVQPPRIEAKYSQFSDVIYYRVDWQFVYNPDGWDKVVLNAGYRQLVTVVLATIQETILIAGQPATAPCLLDTSGHYLPPPVNASDVTYLTFQIYDAISFATTFAFPSTLFGT